MRGVIVSKSDTKNIADLHVLLIIGANGDSREGLHEGDVSFAARSKWSVPATSNRAVVCATAEIFCRDRSCAGVSALPRIA